MTCSHTSCPPGGPCRQTGIPEVTVIPMAPPTFRPGIDDPLPPEIGVGSTGRRIAALEAEGARLRADKAALLAERKRLREALRAMADASEIVVNVGAGRSIGASKCVLCGEHMAEGDVEHKPNCPVSAAHAALYALDAAGWSE